MIIADTGLWLALALPRDRHHALAKQRIADIAAQQERLITTCAVMTETYHLLLARAGVPSQLRFVQQF
jgi:predicted nucleic acid-binding protein